jgi:hypothetical protein
MSVTFHPGPTFVVLPHDRNLYYRFLSIEAVFNVDSYYPMPSDIAIVRRYGGDGAVQPISNFTRI